MVQVGTGEPVGISFWGRLAVRRRLQSMHNQEYSGYGDLTIPARRRMAQPVMILREGQ